MSMHTIATISYSLGGFLFGGLTLLLLFAWRGRGALMIAAVLLTAVCDGFFAYTAWRQLSYPLLNYLLECARYTAWLVFLLHLLNGALVLGRNKIILASILLLLLLGSGLSGGLASGDVAWPFISLLMLTVAGLVLLEQLYRNTAREERWRIKFLCLGLGAIFAYDFYLFANAVLFRQLDPYIGATRGVLHALSVPLLALAVVRNPAWRLKIFVSRHIVFYSGTIVVAGVYLLAMALGGYYLRAYGGSWGGFLQIVFLCAGGLLFLSVMLSVDLRRRCQRFIGEHFFSNKYDYRLEWLRLIDTLSRPDESLTLEQRAVKAVVDIVQARGGILCMRYGEKYFSAVAHWNSYLPHAVFEHEDGQFMRSLAGRDLCLLRDRQHDPLLPAWLRQIDHLWILLPLMHEDQRVGFIVLQYSDYSPAIVWEDEDLLITVGRQLASYLLQARAAERLGETQQFAAYHQLTAFIIHDLKNLLSQLALIVQNAHAHKQNPAFIDDAIETLQHAVNYMGKLIDQLKSGRLLERNERVVLASLLEELGHQHGSEKAELRIEVLSDEVCLHIDRARLLLMLKHLLNNAEDAGASLIKLEAQVENAHACIKIADNGSGMDSVFVREHLFKPFYSTKGAKGMGVGAYEVREFVRRAGGEVLVDSQPGVGTTISLHLPLYDATLAKSLGDMK